jgi:tetratricopeptide (TPR) repeat protein
MRRLMFQIGFFSCFLVNCNQSKGPSSCEQVSKEYYKLLNEARSQQTGREVIDNLNQFINENPRCINSYLLIGDIYYYLNHYDLSKNKFLKAIDIDSNNIYALFKIGLLYQLEKKYDSAVVYFTSAAQKKTVNGFVINKSKELEVVTETPNYDVNYVEIIFNSAKSNYYANNLINSLHEFNYCIRKNSYLKDAFLFRGLIYFRAKDFEKACSDIHLAKTYGNLEASQYLEKYCSSVPRL